jgi:hypothetical protein
MFRGKSIGERHGAGVRLSSGLPDHVAVTVE